MIGAGVPPLNCCCCWVLFENDGDCDIDDCWWGSKYELVVVNWVGCLPDSENWYCCCGDVDEVMEWIESLLLKTVVEADGVIWGID